LGFPLNFQGLVGTYIVCDVKNSGAGLVGNYEIFSFAVHVGNISEIFQLDFSLN